MAWRRCFSDARLRGSLLIPALFKYYLAKPICWHLAQYPLLATFLPFPVVIALYFPIPCLPAERDHPGTTRAVAHITPDTFRQQHGNMRTLRITACIPRGPENFTAIFGITPPPMPCRRLCAVNHLINRDVSTQMRLLPHSSVENINYSLALHSSWCFRRTCLYSIPLIIKPFHLGQSSNE